MLRVSSRQSLVPWDAFDAAKEDDHGSVSDYETCVEGNTVSRENSFMLLTPLNSRSAENLTDLLQQSQHDSYDENYWIGACGEEKLWRDWKRLDGSSYPVSPSTFQAVASTKKRDRSCVEGKSPIKRNVSFSLLPIDMNSGGDVVVTRQEVVQQGNRNGLISNELPPPPLVCQLPTTFEQPLESGQTSLASRRFHALKLEHVAVEKIAKFEDVIDDARLVVFSFLCAHDLRIVSATSKRNLRLSRRTHVWADMCARCWPLLRNLTEEQMAEHRISFRDYSGIPLAPVQSENDAHPTCPNLSVLHGMTQPYPTCIDPKFFLPSVHLRARREAEFRQFEMNVSTTSHPDPRRTNVLQFNAGVGCGDRCVRSNVSFPCVEVSNSKTWFPSAILGLLCRGGRGAMTTAVAPIGAGSLMYLGSSSSSWKLFGITTLKPFVAPYVISSKKADCECNNKCKSSRERDIVETELNVTPRLYAYFEISLLQRDESQEPAPLFGQSDDSPNTNERDNTAEMPPSDCVAIGLSTDSFSINDKMPGWDKASYGYHGDDGGIFHSNGDMLRRFGPTFGVGDTVGCGIDYASQGIFFTLNGTFLGYAWTGVDLSKRLYPTVGVDAHCPIVCNFGAHPFAFDLKPFASQHAELIETAFDGFPLRSSSTSRTFHHSATKAPGYGTEESR